MTTSNDQRSEATRRDRMALLDAWLGELDAEHGAPTRAAQAEAEAWIASAVRVTIR